ncbi:hypothetical protein [Sphingobacterium sp. DR205]|uniref:hypothetical protein n=1 Tax=Sphingobacterium sp. DR205 TaxID=2713573 RepID=UPI0013E479FA|nr:hypothetical protein [Sphingobacterium sp. DR205]QIH33474.1 hypothetical protein G6053_11515 [Sphingobacterium sp. DR205]
MKKIEFIDAQQMKQMHPDTFEVPDQNDLRELKVGDTVKVCAFKERFWAEITAIEGDKITATVENVLLTKFLKYKDWIEFETRHIYDIIKKDQFQKMDQKAIEEMKQRVTKKIKTQSKGHRRI